MLRHIITLSGSTYIIIKNSIFLTLRIDQICMCCHKDMEST